jgi:hypothetical protein
LSWQGFPWHLQRRPSSCENWRAVTEVLARKVRINWRRANNFSSGGNTRPKSVLKCSPRKTKSKKSGNVVL